MSNGAQGTVVQFGAGAIGRGFLAQLWQEGGYETLFVEASPALLERMREHRVYPLRLLDNDSRRDITLQAVPAVAADDKDSIADALAGCSFACTAVGVAAFQSLGPILAAGIVRRLEVQGVDASPLNILCCENQARAGSLLRAAVAAALPDTAPVQGYFASSVAFVDASVGRMVPPPTPELHAEDPLLIVAEPYQELPIDGEAWRGPVPDIPGLLPKKNFAGYVARKLFTHNGGHALLAYEGWLYGHEYIWQAAEDTRLVAHLQGFWEETGTALIRAYGFPAEEQRRHEEDLLRRFRNRALGDTTVRVGRDPSRKLRSDDRLIGAALLCNAQGVEPHNVARAAAAALWFDAPGDSSAGRVRDAVQTRGMEAALHELAGLGEEEPVFIRWIRGAYQEWGEIASSR